MKHDQATVTNALAFQAVCPSIEKPTIDLHVVHLFDLPTATGIEGIISGYEHRYKDRDLDNGAYIDKFAIEKFIDITIFSYKNGSILAHNWQGSGYYHVVKESPDAIREAMEEAGRQYLDAILKLVA